MALTTIPGGLWIPAPISFAAVGAPALSDLALSASNNRVALVVQAPETGTLDLFETLLGAVSNAPDNAIRMSFQDISNSDGNPDGTQDQYRDVSSGISANAWLAPPGVMTSDGTDGGTKRSVTRGDWIGCVIEYTSFVVGDSFNIASSTQAAIGSKGIGDANCYANRYTGTWGTKTSNSPVIALKYSTGAYYPILSSVWPIKTINTRTFNSGSTPFQRGLRFKMPVPCRFAGVWIRCDLDNPASVVLYSAADSVLSTVAMPSATRTSASAQNFTVLMPKVDLAANTLYRVVVKPLTGSSLSFYDFDINAAGLLAAIGGGVEWYSTWGTTGSWTDTDTNRPYMGVLFDAFDDTTTVSGIASLVGGALVR